MAQAQAAASVDFDVTSTERQASLSGATDHPYGVMRAARAVDWLVW